MLLTRELKSPVCVLVEKGHRDAVQEISFEVKVIYTGNEVQMLSGFKEQLDKFEQTERLVHY